MVSAHVVYNTTTTTDEEKAILHTSIDQMNAKIGENIGNDLCYEIGAQGDVAATMISENSWSKKLVGCLRNILPELKDRIIFTGDQGLEFANDQSEM